MYENGAIVGTGDLLAVRRLMLGHGPMSESYACWTAADALRVRAYWLRRELDAAKIAQDKDLVIELEQALAAVEGLRDGLNARREKLLAGSLPQPIDVDCAFLFAEIEASQLELAAY